MLASLGCELSNRREQ